MSYHVDPSGNRFGYNLASQFLPIALCFALTLAATTGFVQLCAMFRFRLGGWAGVALLVVVHAFAAVAGVMVEDRNNPAALLNPLAYAEALTRGDYFMDSTFNSEADDGTWGTLTPPRFRREGGVLLPTDYTPRQSLRQDASTVALRGLAVESVFALLCLYLAALKWRHTRRDLLRDSEA